MLFEPQRHLALAQRLDETVLYRMLAQQFERPAYTSIRWIRAGQGNHLLLLSCCELGRRPRAGSIVQDAFQAALAKMLADVTNHPLRATHMLDDLQVGQPFVGLQQHLRTPDNPCRMRP